MCCFVKLGSLLAGRQVGPSEESSEPARVAERKPSSSSRGRHESRGSLASEKTQSHEQNRKESQADRKRRSESQLGTGGEWSGSALSSGSESPPTVMEWAVGVGREASGEGDSEPASVRRRASSVARESRQDQARQAGSAHQERQERQERQDRVQADEKEQQTVSERRKSSAREAGVRASNMGDEQRSLGRQGSSGGEAASPRAPLVRQAASVQTSASPVGGRRPETEAGQWAARGEESDGGEASSSVESGRSAGTATSGERASRRQSSGSRRERPERTEGAGQAERARRASRSQPPPLRARATREKSSRGPGAHPAAAAPAPNSARQTPDSDQQLEHETDRRLPAAAGPRHSLAAGTQQAKQRDRPRRAISVSPSLASNVNIRHILENVAQIEGPFVEPRLALKVAMDAVESPCWSTKVEGLMALIRLVEFHQPLILNGGQLHELVGHVCDETRNLRSTVARSAIFLLGDMCAKLKRSIEPHLELIVQALMAKSIENTAFIRDDIRRALAQMVEVLTPWRLANSLMHHGASHKSAQVRRMASQFIAQIVERLGPAKCLVGAKEFGGQLIPAAARFAQDSSPFTRYYGRLILSKLMQHASFERLLRQNLAPNLYRSTSGIVESVKRRGPGELPAES